MALYGFCTAVQLLSAVFMNEFTHRSHWRAPIPFERRLEWGVSVKIGKSEAS